MRHSSITTALGSSLIVISLAACSNAREGSGDIPVSTTAEAPAMTHARLVGKRGVPADVRYRFDSSVELNKATGLLVEVKPHIVVDKMSVEVKGPAGIRIDAAPVLAIQKALPSQVYRQNVSVTPLAAGVDTMQVMVTMETPEGLAFGIYHVSLKDSSAGKRPQKRPLE